MSYFRNLDKSLLPDLFKPVQPEPPPSRGLLRGAADLGAEAVSGVARGVKFTADAFGAENAVSRGAGYVDDLARGLLSAQAQGEDQQIAQIMAEAQDKGVWEQVVAAAKAFAVAPGRMAVNALGTSVPAIGAAMIPGVGQAGTAARLATLGGVGAAQGAGVVKGSIYEAVYKAHKQDGASEEEARAAAEQAQAYGGGNTDLIAGGAALGGAATATGAQPIIARALGRQAVDAAVKPGIARGVGRGILAETPLEAAQGGQEQLATNIALQREGANVPTWRGVAGSAALEGMAAAPIGGVAGGIEGAQAKRAAQRKAEADAALTALGSAGTVDEAVALATKATDIPVMPTPYVRDPNSAKETKARNLETLAWVRNLDRPDQTAALGLMAVVNNPRTPDVLRRSASAQLDALERKARTIPTGEAAEVLPTGEATEVDPVPVPAVLEEIPAGDAAEVLPVGDAAEVLPTGEVIEEPEALPTGEATDIEPDQADEALLLTSDGMPYGTLAGARVRAKREGLPPEAVVEVPGGWAVKKESDGERGQPDVAGTAGRPAAAGAGRAPDAVGSGVAVGRVAADAGGGQPASAAGVVGRGGQVRPAGDGGESDPALRVKALSAQWADAVARGDMAEAKRLNDAIVEARKPPEDPQQQDSRGLREYDRRARDIGGAAQELVAQIQGDIAENDFDADEVMPGLELFAKQANVPADDLRQEVLARIRKSGMKRGDIKRVERALDPTKRPAPAPVERPAPDAADPQFALKNELRQLQNALDGDMAPQGVPWDKQPETRKAYERSVSEIQRKLEIAAGSTTDAAALAPQAPPQGRDPEAAAPAAQPVVAAPGRDMMPEGLTVTFGGRTFKVDSLEDAQAKWIEFRDRAGAGVSEVGNGVVVEDGAGRMVGRISYNGRIFDPADNIVAEAPDATPQVSTWTDAPPPAPAPAPTNPPAPAAQTRPERLIELRKRQSVLKQLLECLG